MRRQLKVGYTSRTMAKTYNSGYSLVVTHLTTNPPVRCLNRAERTGSLVFNVLWSYVEGVFVSNNYNLTNQEPNDGKNIQQRVFASGHPPNY
ncbi:uncharacterized protein M421DRAFT_243624 [Didymella exigua CBS 183.55]|uniref:Uncharacterized protein n=1 Tax=Didymella exigua CBS 183.55 TaxID=1150837 RepID=A0A6A5RYV1_9PLEO|nr:uncharacterized protein M421DRAFT_243624 [Didymella exigua CBS 183.55]KAF1932530.1 hypothetical protein M421DRAFT_243624 [Didymella exigua CBS 183.55]